jgi:hypothetical protein
MTGKEMLLFLGGSALVGGGAGVGAAVAARPDPAPLPPTVDTSAIERRLASLEKELDEVRRKRDELQAAVAAVRDGSGPAAAARRLAATEGGAIESTFTAEEAHEVSLADATEEVRKAVNLLHEGLEVELEGKALRIHGAEDGQAFAGRIVGADGEHLKAVAADIQGIAGGLQLRALPEKERWDKAREDLGLTPSQEQDLRTAIEERDRAMDEAMVTEKTEPGAKGGTLTVRRLDSDKAAAANRTFKERLGASLNEEQRGKWKSGGYDHAFGKMPGAAGGGAVSIMTIESKIEDGPVPVGEDK